MTENNILPQLTIEMVKSFELKDNNKMQAYKCEKFQNIILQALGLGTYKGYIFTHAKFTIQGSLGTALYTRDGEVFKKIKVHYVQ